VGEAFEAREAELSALEEAKLLEKEAIDITALARVGRSGARHPLSLLQEKISDVFVGMGTSVLEAANTGTPSCVAVENQGEACYGFLHEAPTDSVGDRVDSFPERRLDDVLHSFAFLDIKTRVKIGQADALAVQQKESTLDEFVAAILSAAPMQRIGLRERAILYIVKAYLKVKHWKLERSGS
jgi:hypothetical protein